jgi:hypothetical protein
LISCEVVACVAARVAERGNANWRAEARALVRRVGLPVQADVYSRIRGARRTF